MQQGESESGERLAVKLDRTHYAVLDQPNASLTVDGQTVQVCDDLGLSLDPCVYAKTRCRTCNGVGSYTVHRKPPMELVRARYEDAQRRAIAGDLDREANAMRAALGVEPSYNRERVLNRRLDAVLRQIANGSTITGLVWCGCAEKRYQQARSLVQTTVKQKG